MIFNPLQYVVNVATLVFSVSANVATGGSYRETFSSRMGRYRVHRKKWKRVIGKPVAGGIDWLLGKGHCARAAANEKRVYHSPEALDDEPDPD